MKKVAGPIGRPKGLPKTGGRKKKIKPTESNLEQWNQILSQNFFTIPEQAVKLYFDDKTSNTLKFSILQFLANYTTAAIKPTEIPEKEEESYEDVSLSPLEIIDGGGNK